MDRFFDIEEKVSDFFNLHKEKENLEARLREIDSELSTSLSRLVENQPQDFVADITTATEIDKMVIEKFNAFESAGEADSFTYSLVLKQYIEPPAQPGTDDLDEALDQEADELMDIMDIPDALSAPNFGDPTPPLQGTIDEFKNAMESLGGLRSAVTDLFGE